ncbi:MAG: sensor histidine kinase, partial [Defluviitaleaceae bacterium]|nr:sensor histidine kinase [Defluviitaleaceae bacterium]
DSILDTQSHELNQSLVQEINYIRDNYEKQADSIMANQTIQDALSKAPDASPDPAERQAVEWALMDPANKILSVLVGGDSVYQSQTAAHPYITYDGIVSSAVYARALASQGSDIWVALQENITTNDNSPGLYLCKTINLTKYDFRAIGRLIMQIPLEDLSGVFDRGQLAENEYFAVTDENGVYIYDTLNKNMIGERVGSDLRFTEDAAEEVTKTIDTPGGAMTIYYSPYFSKTGRTGWNVIHAVPTAVTTAYATRIRDIVSGIMLVLLLISMPLVLILLNGITMPIVRLKNAVAAFGNALHTRVKVDRKDEIGSLQESFNWMAEDIEKLLAETEENHRRLRELELSALEYQVNPHFLYNSLDSLYWMARKDGSEDVAEMIKALAKFLRIGLRKGQETYLVKDELEHARQYLMINKIRLEDQFEFEITAGEEILNLAVVKIILQPIVENAIKYGIGKNRQKGHIAVSGRLQDGHILFTVADNGPGVPAERLAAIENSLAGQSLPQESENGFGLHYVSQRLSLYYGNDAGVKIENGANGGAVVSVWIPVIETGTADN